MCDFIRYMVLPTTKVSVLKQKIGINLKLSPEESIFMTYQDKVLTQSKTLESYISKNSEKPYEIMRILVIRHLAYG